MIAYYSQDVSTFDAFETSIVKIYHQILSSKLKFMAPVEYVIHKDKRILILQIVIYWVLQGEQFHVQ